MFSNETTTTTTTTTITSPNLGIGTIRNNLNENKYLNTFRTQEPEPEDTKFVAYLKVNSVIDDELIYYIMDFLSTLSTYDREYINNESYRQLIDSLKTAVGEDNLKFFKIMEKYDVSNKLKTNIINHPRYEEIKNKVLKLPKAFKADRLPLIFELIDADLLTDDLFPEIISSYFNKEKIKNKIIKKYQSEIPETYTFDIGKELTLENTIFMYYIAIKINENGFLSQSKNDLDWICKAAAEHSILDYKIYPSTIKVIKYLSENNLLTEKSFNACWSFNKFDSTRDTASFIELFNDYSEIFTKKFIESIFDDRIQIMEFEDILRGLGWNRGLGYNLLTPRNLERIVNYSDLKALSFALTRIRPEDPSPYRRNNPTFTSQLKKEHEENLEFVFACRHPDSAVLIKRYLQKINLFTENKQLLINHPNQNQLYCILKNFPISIPVKQNQFEKICAYSHILFMEPDQSLLTYIPVHLFNDNFLRRIFNYCALVQNQENSHQLVSEFIIQAMQPTTKAGVLNTAQSTHTASVHASVSDSAIKLKKRYGKTLEQEGLDTIIMQISDFVATLPGEINERTNENSAAKRLTLDLSSETMFWQFKDPKSNVTNIELLALTWLSINDEQTLICSSTEAKNRFIRSLYEIQRGYNLNDDGDIDDGEKDNPICLPGSFNKMIEGLNTIHPDVEIIYITKPGAALKIQNSTIVMDTIIAHLNFEKLTLEELNALKETFLIKGANIDNIEHCDIYSEKVTTLWNNVKASIEAKMKDFLPAFKDEKTFSEFIDAAGLQCIDVATIIEKIDAHITSCISICHFGNNENIIDDMTTKKSSAAETTTTTTSPETTDKTTIGHQEKQLNVKLFKKSGSSKKQNTKLTEPEKLLNELKNKIINTKWDVSGFGGVIRYDLPNNKNFLVPYHVDEILKVIKNAEGKNVSHEQALKEITDILSKIHEKDKEKIMPHFFRTKSTEKFYSEWHEKLTSSSASHKAGKEKFTKK